MRDEFKVFNDPEDEAAVKRTAAIREQLGVYDFENYRTGRR